MHMFEGRPARPSARPWVWLLFLVLDTAVRLVASSRTAVLVEIQTQTQTQAPLNIPRSLARLLRLSYVLAESSTVKSLQDFGGKQQQRQPRSTVETQRLPRTFSLIPRALREENRLMEYYPTTADTSQVSFSHFSQPQPQPHPQTQPQTQAQAPLNIPSSLTRLMALYFGVNPHNTRNEDSFFVTSTQPPATPPVEEEASVFPSGQPYIPAYHQQSSTTRPPLDSVPADPQLFVANPVSLISTGTSCFSNAACTMGVALTLAIGASSLFLLPFQGRRRRSVDEDMYPNEVIKKDFVSVPPCSDVIIRDPRC